MADNKPAVLGGTAIKPKERHGWEAVRYLLHNPETGEYLTRTPKSWALITIFYIIYYSCLAAFWAAMLMIFFQTLEDGKPKWIGADSLIGVSPGVGLAPAQHPDKIDSSMIQFNKEKADSDGVISGYQEWVDRANAFLEPYKNQKASKECSAGNGATNNEACKFDIAALGPCGTGDFGYAAGNPCVYLKLNKIYGVSNVPYTDASNDDMPEGLKKHINGFNGDKEQVWIDCRGEYPADREALKGIEYYPNSRGFPNYYFPFMRQEGYISPIVAVQFKDLPVNQLVHIECRAWAKNINYDKRDRIGINHLEIHVLDQAGTNAINDS